MAYIVRMKMEFSKTNRNLRQNKIQLQSISRTSPVILFDLDGTLTDPKLGIVSCIKFALEQLGNPSPCDDVLTTFIGPPLRGTFSSLLGTADHDLIEQAMALYRQ